MKMVIRIREPKKGVLRARVPAPLSNFYNLAAEELHTDIAVLIRPALRENAIRMAKKNPRLRRFAHGI